MESHDLQQPIQQHIENRISGDLGVGKVVDLLTQTREPLITRAAEARKAARAARDLIS